MRSFVKKDPGLAQKIRDFFVKFAKEIRAIAERYMQRDGAKRYEIANLLGRSDVQTREAEDILRLLGVDVSGYTHNIDKNGFNHIEKRHGPDGKHDRTMADLNDVARMGWIINNYDTIEVSLDKNGEIELSAGYRDANGRPAPKVVYKKRINGTYYLVEAVADNDWKKLWVITAYINKKGLHKPRMPKPPG